MKSMSQEDLPLAGLLVIDFSQFLSGPLASLKLADLGARVIKIERPTTGDLCRTLYLSDTDIDGDTSLFHAINRNKESFVADLRNDDHRRQLRSLISKADVMIQNFRPGVIERQGFSAEEMLKLNPRLIYGSISGYGDEGPWRDLPGQDLLAQARSGLMWLTGNRDDPPLPMGLAAADMLAGSALTQGILAALVGRSISGKGRKVETSLMEALLDFQFEVLTTHFNDGNRMPERSAIGGAHAYLGAPYGVYPSANGFMVIAMTPSLRRLAELLEITDELDTYLDDPKSSMTHRDEIKTILTKHIATRTTEEWLAILQPADIWCAEVLDWRELMKSEAFLSLDMRQTITRSTDLELETLRGPLRLDNQKLTSSRAAPTLGQHTALLIEEFDLA